MPLSPGERLGPYEVVALLGAGGMGEVYRARDTRLGRDVAIKVLSSHVTATPEIRARFEREARTISQLNHPNICTLFDVGRDGDTDYLVMELLEGQTLSRRLEKGPLPVAEMLSLGIQIAEALDRAHRGGVVHRDLKPGNVMLTKAGAKLMDFGLARAVGLAPAAGTVTQSPTLSRPLTAEGTIVGTFQYMAPEQLEGGEADVRSDVWALGCVLYEMATGKRPFEGKSQASLIAAIIEREPARPSQLMPLLPPALDRVVQQCLAKDPEERIQTAHDVKLELTWIASAGSQAGVPAPLAARRRHRERLAWALAGVLALAVAALGSLMLRPSPPPQVIRFEIHPPRGTTRPSWPRLSPDGKLLAFLATDSTGTQRIWVRALDALEARPLEAALGGARPFWSPDSRWLAFIKDGKLLKVPVAGGPTVSICDARGGYDGTWGRDGWILFDGGATDSIRGVPASGGEPRAVTFLDRSHGETGHAWPFFLPDGRHFLFVASNAGGANEIRIGTLGSRESRTAGHTDSRAEYAPPGYLVYENGGVLMAQRFDPGAARTRGDPVPVSDITTSTTGWFSVSTTGALAFRARTAQGLSRLLWVDRNGRVIEEAAPPGRYEDLVLSPDATRVALSIVSEQPSQRDIWIRDLRRGVSSRITFDPGDEFAPAWSPDGNRIVYAAVRADGIHCYIRSAWGSGVEDSLGRSPGFYEGPYGWSGAANIIVVSHVAPTNHWDVYALSPEGRQPPRPLLQSPFNQWAARLSPDGRWLAYTSNESGIDEIYVVPYPGPGPRIQVSAGGGQVPQWRGDGKELFFQGMDQSILAVDVRAGTDFEAGEPRVLFTIPLTALGTYRGYRWASALDGQRFLINASSGDAFTGRFVVVSNWTQELRGK